MPLYCFRKHKNFIANYFKWIKTKLSEIDFFSAFYNLHSIKAVVQEEKC